MKTLNQKREVKVDSRRGLIALVCNKINNILSFPSGLAPLGYSGHDEVTLEVDREGQFAAYVHNRMNILLIWIQHMSKRDITEHKRHLEFFLHDMEHHFVDPYVDKKLRVAFRWIKVYIKIYPAVFKKDRTQRAYEMVGRIYEALGIECRL